MTRLSRGCIQGGAQVFLKENQGAVRQLGLPVGSVVAEMGKDKPGQRSLGKAEGQKLETPSTMVIIKDDRSTESRVRITLDQIESRTGISEGNVIAAESRELAVSRKASGGLVRATQRTRGRTAQQH